MKPSPRRRGQVLILVLLLMVLFMGLWGMAARQIGTMLRIEQARANRIPRTPDPSPAMSALAQALAALEVGYPPSSPYIASVSMGRIIFTVTYTLVDSSGPNSTWSVQVAPDSNLYPLLDTRNFIPQHP
jgi:hypothetical protein